MKSASRWWTANGELRMGSGKSVIRSASSPFYSLLAVCPPTTRRVGSPRVYEFANISELLFRSPGDFDGRQNSRHERVELPAAHPESEEGHRRGPEGRHAGGAGHRPRRRCRLPGVLQIDRQRARRADRGGRHLPISHQAHVTAGASRPAQPFDCGTRRIEEDWANVIGHMRAHQYVALFDDANTAFLSGAGLTDASLR